jgi:hypothetical protein
MVQGGGMVALTGTEPVLVRLAVVPIQVFGGVQTEFTYNAPGQPGEIPQSGLYCKRWPASQFAQLPNLPLGPDPGL